MKKSRNMKNSFTTPYRKTTSIYLIDLIYIPYRIPSEKDETTKYLLYNTLWSTL